MARRAGSFLSGKLSVVGEVVTLLGHTHLPTQVVAPLWDYSKSPSSPIAHPSSMSCPVSRTPLGTARPPHLTVLCVPEASLSYCGIVPLGHLIPLGATVSRTLKYILEV